jgi:hypothetical protein
MSTEANASDNGFVPPYISYKTLTGLLDRMEREDPPARIDKSYLDNLSGGYRTQVLAALNSLGLVAEDGTLSERLKAMVAGGEAGRKRIVTDIVREHYGPVVNLPRNATQQQMVAAFEEMSPTVTGDTRRKAIAFFLNACRDAGITVSPHWKTPRVPSSGKGRKQRDSGDADGGAQAKTEEEPVVPQRPPVTAQNIRSVELRSGGTLTLMLTGDTFAMSSADRTFVFGLVENLETYENQRAMPAGDQLANGSEVSVGVQT